MDWSNSNRLANKQHYFISVKGMPEDALELVELTSDGFGLSSDFELQVTALVHMPIEMAQLIGKSICVSTLWESDRSYWHGVITNVLEQGASQDGEQIQIRIHSPFWILKQRSHNRVFRNVTCLEIVKEVIQKAGITESIAIFGNAPTCPFVVQYEESDFDFVCRLLFRYGFFFTFVQKEHSCEIVIGNNIADISQKMNSVALPYVGNSGQTRQSETVFAISRKTQWLTDAIQLNDYNYQQPSQLLTQSTNQTSIAGVGLSYHYGDHYLQSDEGEQLIQIRQQALDVQRQSIIIDTDCRGLQPGMVVDISYHPEWSGQWVVVSVEHSGNQQGALKFGNIASQLTYRGQARLIPTGLPYRTALIEPRRILGTFTATVASPLDDQGRYEIQLGFDLDQKASHPVRLMQPYGGADHGMHFPFTEGTEVIIACENGDPDRPVILGALYNSEALSPVTSNNPTENILRTRAQNELLMDDKDSAAQIKLSTKDQRNRLHFDATEGAHQTHLMSEEGEMFITAGSHMSIQVGENQTTEVGGDHTIVVAKEQRLMTEQGNIEFQSAKDISMRAENNIHWQSISSGMTIQSDQNFSLSAGQAMSFYTREGNLEWMAESGDVIVDAKANITLKSAGSGVIQIAQGNGRIEIDSSGNLIIDAPKVEINADNIAIKGSGISNN